MLSEKQKLSKARRWKHYLEALIYTECLAHGMKKTPHLEIADDKTAYQGPGLIHIGTGMIDAKDDEDLFAKIHYLLGHEMQHLLSSTDKDWNAAHKLCFRNACQRISVKVFGKTRRLTKESDYEQFFEELSKKGVFINQKMIMDYAHFLLNTLEDGRIENIRPRKHPGFGAYRKVFRADIWMHDNFKDESFFKENPDDLSKVEELQMLLGQIYYLSTLGIYQNGFLDAYGNTKARKLVDSFVPDISRAVLGKTCKVCMDQGRIIFDRLLDRVIDACMLEADAKLIQEFLEHMLKVLMDEAKNQKLSASPNSEEQGDGLPAESLFGDTALEIELDEEEYEELMENADESDEDKPGVKIKVKKKGGDEDADAEGSDGSGSATGDETSEDEPSEDKAPSDNSPTSETDGEKPDEKSQPSASDNSDDASNPDDEDANSEESEEAGKGMKNNSEEVTDANSTGGEDLETEPSESLGLNNRVEEGSAEEKGAEDLEASVREAAEKAAERAKADFELAEADAKLDEQFREAASGLKAVAPAEVDLSRVDSSYDDDVEFVETTRTYDPIGRLPLELENKGKSLHHKIEELVKNKQDPDQRYLKSGMLDTRRLTNLAMGDLNVFKKKGEPNKSDVACFLLQDNSGSMGDGPGSTRFACCNAFAVLEEGFKRHMPLKIAAFDSRGIKQVSHEVVKEFDEVTEPNLAFNFRDLGRDGWGNKDGYSIRVATQQLLARPEKDKILIIASDGFPTEYRGGHAEGCADVKSAVAEARKAGVRTVGMYMYHEQNDNDFAVFQDMYGPEIIFASLDEIEDELTRILKRYF